MPIILKIPYILCAYFKAVVSYSLNKNTVKSQRADSGGIFIFKTIPLCIHPDLKSGTEVCSQSPDNLALVFPNTRFVANFIFRVENYLKFNFV